MDHRNEWNISDQNIYILITRVLVYHMKMTQSHMYIFNRLKSVIFKTLQTFSVES